MDAKELIASKVEERKTITDYHLKTKKAQATVLRSTPTLTITVFSDQVLEKLLSWMMVKQLPGPA